MRYIVSKAVLEAWGSETPPEQNMIEWAAQLLQPGRLFIDVGAHVGTYALQYAQAGADVVAFEAQWATYCHLVAGILQNDLIDRVRAHHVALGDGSSRTIELRAISADGGGSSTLPLSTHQEPLSVEAVECRTLDSYQLSNVGLIKLDVEGAELNVLKGALQTLARSEYPKILFETWRESRMPEAKQLRADLFRFLQGLGYRLVQLGRYDEIWLAER